MWNVSYTCCCHFFHLFSDFWGYEVVPPSPFKWKNPAYNPKCFSFTSCIYRDRQKMHHKSLLICKDLQSIEVLLLCPIRLNELM